MRKKLTQDEIAAQFKGMSHRRELKKRLRHAHRDLLKRAKRERWSPENLEKKLAVLPDKVLKDFQRARSDFFRNRWAEKRLVYQGGAFESKRSEH